MTNETEKIQGLLEKRLALVGEMSRLNAEQLLNSQQLSGNQIDLMRCADTLEEQSGSGELRAELTRAEARDELLKSRICDCENRLQALEEQVAELDRQLEAL